MRRQTPALRRSAANRWSKKLAADVAAVTSRYPDADAEDVRLTLISLQSPPLVRLNRSLRRGRVEALKRKLAALNPKDQRYLMAFLISLQDERNNAYRKKLGEKIDKPASEFATLDELDSRLNLKGGEDK